LTFSFQLSPTIFTALLHHCANFFAEIFNDLLAFFSILDPFKPSVEHTAELTPILKPLAKIFTRPWTQPWSITTSFIQLLTDFLHTGHGFGVFAPLSEGGTLFFERGIITELIENGLALSLRDVAQIHGFLPQRFQIEVR
jgi:hypothetical protein